VTFFYFFVLNSDWPKIKLIEFDILLRTVIRTLNIIKFCNYLTILNQEINLF